MSASEDFAWCRRQIESWKSYRSKKMTLEIYLQGLAVVARLRLNGLVMDAKYTLTEIRSARFTGGLDIHKLEMAERAMRTYERPPAEFPWLIPAAQPWVWDGAE